MLNVTGVKISVLEIYIKYANKQMFKKKKSNGYLYFSSVYISILEMYMKIQF